MIRSMEEFRSAFHAARCVSTPLVAVRTADPASPLGDPPALPGRQQKFDNSRSTWHANLA